MAAPIVQYVVVRGDLLRVLKWPIGAVITQACHASTAVIHLFRNDSYTEKYTAELDHMHKIVLEAPDEKSLTSLAEILSENSVQHKLWIEEPENIPTCLATKPCPKDEIQQYFKKLKLFK